MTKWQSVFVRFVKGFIAGGSASALAVLSAGVVVSSYDDLIKLGFSLLTAFLTGGILSFEKWYSWVE